ncbi:protein NRT1/ PTR FAMILY 2.3-like isoform X2 [Phragmites australis]|uniref:protein NRT1/ PTR FAMILY 2.3-like isoform X2 n=1 Tax=Phragmites australis TaxID=29695 RepID=UPI002D7A0837|nr:protein NRT1/ PTR FAMILY 2.3-like isoform X2 [Phragmites australis]
MRTTAYVSSDHESHDHQTSARKKGGLITLPFLAGSVMGLGMAMSATSSNLIVYLIKKYNVKSIDAAQISNIVRGCMQLAPVVGAVVSDAFFGCYPVAAAGVAVSLLSFVLFTLTATFPSLRPQSCPTPGAESTTCQPPSATQAAVLYAAVCLLAVGNGGTRYNMATMGADQFDGGDRRHHHRRDAFFSWYFAFLYASYMVGDTVVVYVQDSVSWAMGFGVCAATAGLGLVALVAGSRYYQRPVPNGSPFTALARVAVAAARKATLDSRSLGRGQYYHGSGRDTDTPTQTQDHAPSETFRFLNRAAMVTPDESETNAQDRPIARPWRLCTVQEVENLKSLLRVLPLWASGILVSMTVNAQVSLTVLQALTMDRTLGPHFAVPAASMTVTVLAAFVLFAALFDRLAIPHWERLTDGKLTPLRRVGLGHAVNIASMAVAALVERRRIGVAHVGSGDSARMSALWLVAQLALTGAEEALHLPGNTALFYQEFPATLRSTATAMPPLFIAVGSYMSTAFVDVVRRATGWLPDDLNRSRLDSVYWTLALVAAVNFGYFLVCASMYEYKNADGGGKPQILEEN